MTIIRSTPVAAGESAGYVDFVVELDAAASNEVRVSYQTDNGTATYGSTSDYTYQTGTLVFAPGETSKTVRVLVANDTSVEATEVLWLDLYTPVNATLAQRYVPAYLFDNDASAGTPAISVSDAVVDETGRNASFVVTLSRPATGTVSAGWSTVADTATAGADFTTGTGTLSFAPGEVAKTLTVPIVNDGQAEGDEHFKLVLGNPTGATLAQATGWGLIGRNDADPTSTPRVTVRPIVVGEHDRYASFVVQLDAPSVNEVRLSYQTDNGSAAYGNSNDYMYLADTLVFAPGETTKQVQVPLINDTTAEAPEVFWLDLHSPVNAVITQRYAAALLVDNDGSAGTPTLQMAPVVVDEGAQTASFAVMLSRPAAGTVSVNWATADGSAQAGSDFTGASGTLSFAPGEVVKTVTVNLTNDTLAEPDEHFTLVLSGASGATLIENSARALIGRNDTDPTGTPRVFAQAQAVGEGDRFIQVAVQLSAPSPNEVRVTYQTLNGTADYGSSNDYHYLTDTLVFAPGETTRLVQLPLVNDTTAEPTEVMWLDLYSPVNALVPQRYTPVLIVDNDGNTGTPAVSISDPVVDESNHSASFFVTLSRPSTGTVGVAWATANGTAQAGTDFTAASGTLAFAAGEVVKTVTIDLQDDSLAEADEFFSLVLSAPSGATLAEPAGVAMIGRSDAEALSTPHVSVRPVAVGESETFVNLAVSLSAPSTNEVRVTYQTLNGSADYGSSNDYHYQTQTLVFAPGETTRLVQVPVNNDTATEGSEVFWLDLYSPVNAVVPQRYTPVLLVDNDGTTGTPALGVSDAVVNESAQTLSFFVTLSRPSTGVVSVNYASADDSAQAGSDYLAAAGTLSFQPGETVRTVTLSLLDDALAESDELLQLRLSQPVGATLGDATGSALIGRNDTPPISTPQITASPLTVSEGDRWAQVLVQLSAPARNEVRVSYQTANGSATYGSSNDYHYQTQTLVFAPGETTRVVTLLINDDTSSESTESFSIELYSPVNATVPQRLTGITLLDNDGAGNLYSRGRGNDSYTVASALDRIAESPNGGIDTVTASISLTLPDNVEHLVLTGSALNGLGNAGNNTFTGTAANNSFDGKDGIDTVVFTGPRAAYAINGSTTQRTVSGGTDGTDTLYAVERLQFSDVLLASDTSPGGNVYLAYAMLNAVFNAAPTTAMLSQWTAQLDRLGSLTDTAQAFLNTYAPGLPDEVLVAYLWGTITGTQIPLDALATYTTLVGNGTYTQAGLLALVSTLDLNTVEITSIVGQTLTLDASWFPVPA
ncbi:MAG: hypothetical protein HY855_04540 [Burkholderiales bacterium]|nr:hypothetical protein [Burkholderiales bacterium]